MRPRPLTSTTTSVTMNTVNMRTMQHAATRELIDDLIVVVTSEVDSRTPEAKALELITEILSRIAATD